jgi:hypothetical protein
MAAKYRVFAPQNKSPGRVFRECLMMGKSNVLLLTTLVPFGVAIGWLVILKRKVLRTREETMLRARQRAGSRPFSGCAFSAGDTGYVSDTGGWSFSSWFADSGMSGHDSCTSSDSGGDCGGGGD